MENGRHGRASDVFGNIYLIHHTRVAMPRLIMINSAFINSEFPRGVLVIPEEVGGGHHPPRPRPKTFRGRGPPPPRTTTRRFEFLDGRDHRVDHSASRRDGRVRRRVVARADVRALAGTPGVAARASDPDARRRGRARRVSRRVP